MTVLQDAYYSQNSKARPSLAMMEEKIEVAAFGRQVLQEVSLPRLILCDTHWQAGDFSNPILLVRCYGSGCVTK